MNKALVRMSNGALKFCSLEKPLTGPAEVLVSLHIAGVCGTDLQILRGLRQDSATIIGHEAIGRIIEVGKVKSTNVEFDVGDKVTFNPTSKNNQDRILGHNIQGVFQQYILLKCLDLEQGILQKVDGDIPDYLGALIEPLASVIYAHELVNQTLPMQSAAIFGAGTIGLLHTLHLHLCGVKQVFLIHPNLKRLDWALQHGCIGPDSAISSKNKPIEQVLEQTQKEGIDAAFICTPRNTSLEALRTALQLVKPGGCIDLVGGFEPNTRCFELPDIDFTQIRRANSCGQPQRGITRRVKTISGRCLILTGHRGVSHEHLQKSAKQLKQYSHWYGRLITHIVSLQAAAYLLNKFRQTGVRCIQNKEWVKLAIDCKRNDFYIKSNDIFSEVF